MVKSAPCRGSYRPLRLLQVPQSKYRWHVVAESGLPDVNLTCFLAHLEKQLSPASVPAYARELIGLLNWALLDRVVQEKGWSALGSPREVRNVVTGYLTTEAKCRVVTRPDSFGQVARYIKRSDQTATNPRLLLSVLKRLFNYLREEGKYAYDNPLVLDGAASFRRQLHEAERDAFHKDHGRDRMPSPSGVDDPAPSFRLSENYFRYVEDQWRPQSIDDPSLPAAICEAGREVGWGLREQCFTRMLFESGARISEISALRFDDWAVSTFLNRFLAQNKGSHGCRVKELIVSSPTTKMLRRYVDTPAERRHADPLRLTMAVVQGAWRGNDPTTKQQLGAQPIFLSRRGTPYTPDHYRRNYWHPALKAAGMDADPHQARHWFVTNAMRTIEATCRTEAQIRTEKLKLIAYMSWRSGERTLACYEHSLKAAGFMRRLQAIHRVMFPTQRRHLKKKCDKRAHASGAAADHELSEDLRFILGEDEER